MSRSRSQPAGSDRKVYEYQAAQLARATATITPRRHKASSSCEIRAGLGSGTLTSDSRMTTAYHVVDGAVEDYAAYFESSPAFKKSSRYVAANSSTLGLIPPDAKTSGYPGGWEATIAHRSDAKEESPFLANRLFILGLDTWSDPTKGKNARNALRRGFRFIIDRIMPGHARYSANSPAGQGFVFDLGISIEAGI